MTAGKRGDVRRIGALWRVTIDAYRLRTALRQYVSNGTACLLFAVSLRFWAFIHRELDKLGPHEPGHVEFGEALR